VFISDPTKTVLAEYLAKTNIRHSLPKTGKVLICQNLGEKLNKLKAIKIVKNWKN
jgi:hypothetical protein